MVFVCWYLGAHIIVTPEDDICGWVFTRETIYPYTEAIPDPQVGCILCAHPGIYHPCYTWGSSLKGKTAGVVVDSFECLGTSSVQ